LSKLELKSDIIKLGLVISADLLISK